MHPTLLGRALAMVLLSVHSFVHLSNAWIVTKLNNCLSIY